MFILVPLNFAILFIALIAYYYLPFESNQRGDSGKKNKLSKNDIIQNTNAAHMTEL